MRSILVASLLVFVLTQTNPAQAAINSISCQNADGSVKFSSDAIDGFFDQYKILSAKIIERKDEDLCELSKSRKKVPAFYAETSLRQVQYKILGEIETAWVLCETIGDDIPRGDKCLDEAVLPPKAKRTNHVEL